MLSPKGHPIGDYFDVDDTNPNDAVLPLDYSFTDSKDPKTCPISTGTAVLLLGSFVPYLQSVSQGDDRIQ